MKVKIIQLFILTVVLLSSFTITTILSDLFDWHTGFYDEGIEVSQSWAK